MELFKPAAPSHLWHPIFKRLMSPEFGPERLVLTNWAEGFVDRDNKFVYEFQTTFESCLWELYLFAFLKEQNLSVDFNHQSPDFIISAPIQFSVEAVIASPPQGGQPAFGFSGNQLPDDLNEFNSQATLRICNSFTSKEKRYREIYINYEYVSNKPFLIAICPFDRPNSHLSANLPIMAALYGSYYDEESTIANQSDHVKMYEVSGVQKKADVSIPVGYFTDDTYKHVSAVVYSSLATFGKIRALADNPDAPIVFTTFHPNEDSLIPNVRTSVKKHYVEYLADGLYVFHNPFAENPLDMGVLHHNRIAQFIPQKDGSFEVRAPDDFLLIRSLRSLKFV